MKKNLLILILFVLTTKSYSNSIDSLNTFSDVNKFLAKIDTWWENKHTLKKQKRKAQEFGKNTFHKIDIDVNGLTDLVIDADNLFVILDKGNGNYKINSVDKGTFLSQKYTLVSIINIENIPLMVVKKYNDYHKKVEQYEKMDTLTFLFNDFIEYNPNPKSMGLEELTFSTSGCFGTCSVFEISLMKERKASFNAIKYNDINGQHYAIIDSVSYERIIQIIDYIDLTKLKTEYAVNWTDDQTGKINFKFSGQNITVTDYGLIGTFGLEILYNHLFTLRNGQIWNKQ